MKKLVLVLICCGLVLYGCGDGPDSENPYADMVYNFDMSGASNSSARAVRSMAADSGTISSFEKYEIEVVFVYIALFDTEADGNSVYDQKTLYNVDFGSGTTIDLVTESLSDKLPLSITEPQGNGIDKIWVGLAPTVTARGYINHDGTVYRTRSDGTISADGATEDAEDGVFTVNGFSIPAKSVDSANPPVAADLCGIYLLLGAGGAKIAGHDQFQFNGDDSTIDLKFPLEAGIVYNNNDNEYQTGSMGWVTPFIDGTSRYEKYYLKPAGGAYYTDLMRILTDLNGNPILGQLVLGPISSTGSLLNGKFQLWYETYGELDDMTDDEIDAYYAEWFSQDEANSSTFYFKAAVGSDTLTCDSFERADHSGTMTVNGSPVSYDCLKIE